MKYGEFSIMMAKIEGILKEYNLIIGCVSAQLGTPENNETSIDIYIESAPPDIGTTAEFIDTREV